MQNTLVSDKELILEYRTLGNPIHLQHLVNKYKDKIFTTIIMLVRDQHKAEDIFQDTFIKVIDTIKAGKYTEEGKFLPWASRIAHNLCIDYFRKEKKMPFIATPDGKDVFSFLDFAEDTIEDQMIKEQSHSKIRKLVDLLPKEQKEVLVLRHYSGLSFKEIAEQTDVSINTALGRMRYALNNLRKMIRENGIML